MIYTDNSYSVGFYKNNDRHGPYMYFKADGSEGKSKYDQGCGYYEKNYKVRELT